MYTRRRIRSSGRRRQESASSSSSDSGEGGNPFRVPDTVGVYTLAQVKAADAAAKAAREARRGERAKRRAAARAEREREALAAQEAAEAAAKSTRDIVAKASVSIRKQAGKENLREMIRNKREMFLIEFSLGVKRDEMRKLEEHAHAAETRIEHERKMLALEAQKWEEYTTYSTERVKAIQRQEAETLKEVESKEAELRALDEDIKDVSARIHDQDEVISKYEVLKEFLISLAPEEWVTEQLRAKRERQLRRREARREAKKARAEAREARKAAAATARKAAAESVAGRSRANTLSLVQTDPMLAGTLGADGMLLLGESSESSSGSGSESDEGSSYESSSGAEIPMYFKSPDELLVVFHELEKSNLSLVNNSQEIEEALDSLRHKYASVRDSLAAELDSLRRRLQMLDKELETERRRVSSISARKAYFERNALQVDAAAGDSAEVVLSRLEGRVRDLYAACCRDPEDEAKGGGSELHLRTIDMLTNFERVLRNLVVAMRGLDRGEVAKREKELKKIRDKANRTRNLADMNELWEKRRAKHQDRVQRDARQSKVGRKLMRRSDPIVKRKKGNRGSENKAERDAMHRYFFG